MNTSFEQDPTWPTYSYHDAYFLGSLTAIGIAMPNAKQLSEPAHTVTDPETLTQETRRLVHAMEAISSLSGTTPVGLAHSQLALTDEMPYALDLFIAAVEDESLPPVATIGDLVFRGFVNAIVRPVPGAPTILFKEGCFSSGPVSTITERPTVVRVTSTHPDGVRRSRQHRDQDAIVLQHEDGHSEGKRAADRRDATRNWVSRERLDAHRALTAVQAATDWSPRCTYPHWRALSRDPNYLFLPTPELQAAFDEGRRTQSRRRHT